MTIADTLSKRYPILLEEPEYFNVSAWTGHTPFAMLVIALTMPRVFVELGTHYGVSYMAFCQAVKKLNTQTRCFAVDTWQGDNQAGEYNARVLGKLKEVHDPHYAEFSTLLHMTFDQAVSQFADGSIDLLHIDGYHTYEAVSHDFETWLPKMSDRGVILFHDTMIRLEGYGVWRFWEEVALKYPSFNFTHYYGLGILAVGKNYPSELDVFIRATPAEEESLRLLFYQLADRLYDNEIRARTEELHSHHEERYVNYERQISALTEQLNVLTAEIHRLQDTQIRARVQRLLGIK